MHLSITPKFHILTTYTIEQGIQFGGIAEKVEDFVDKSHHIGKRLDHLECEQPGFLTARVAKNPAPVAN